MTKIALIVGHSKKDGGAVNLEKNINEFSFNDDLAKILFDKLTLKGHNPVIVYRESYSGLPAKVNATNADVALSLHCNAFNKQADGCEVLYYHKSTKGAKLAQHLVTSIVGMLGNPNRGIKPIAYEYVGSKGDRGGWIVEKTKMPCVIVEPFFIDYTPTLIYAMANKDALAQAYVDGLLEYLNELG